MSDAMEIDEQQSKGSLKKPEKDFSVQTTQLIEKSQQTIATHGLSKLKEVVEDLLNLEKQTRLASDAENTSKLVVEVVRHCGNLNAWADLNENVSLIAKKRTQFKQTITKLVQEAATFVDKTPSKETKIELINTLRQVTEGKVCCHCHDFCKKKFFDDPTYNYFFFRLSLTKHNAHAMKIVVIRF